ncbi:MAG: hypothetical protein QOH15_2046 [Gaiellales bacterium]|nr:hypothetical protein [Gaiellales bacterium]
MTGRQRLAFPLISRRRLVGSAFGTQRSVRRGRGSETAGTRPYLPGDPISTIEWVASARLSAAHGADEFIVRERFAEEAPLVAIVLDRRPSMGIYDAPSPWLEKPRAASIAVRAIVESADVARAVVDLLVEPARAPRPLHPSRGRVDVVGAQVAHAGFQAPEDVLDRAIAGLARRRASLPAGSFVFVISDFNGSIQTASRATLRNLGPAIVPVIIQDPTWERSFPDVPGVLLPMVDVVTGEPRPVRLSPRETRARKEQHEQRYGELAARFRRAGMDPVTLGEAEPEPIHRAFLAWAERRRRMLRRT